MSVSRQEIDRQIDELSKLPILPQILVNLNQVAENRGSSADDLADVILKDQSLTMRVLKVVNSAYYRRHQREVITTITKAVVTLGFNGVRRLALGMSVYDMLREAERVTTLHDFWSHSLITAIAARQLAQLTGHPSEEEAFVAGLVHDIGKLVLASADPVLYGQLLAVPSDAPLRERERASFGLNHAQAGRRLARRWGMPAVLEEAIGDHHIGDGRPADRGQPLLTRLVVAANRFAPFVSHPEETRSTDDASAMLADVLELKGLEAEILYEQVIMEYAELAQVFEVADLMEYRDEPDGQAARSDVDPGRLTTLLTEATAGLAGAMPPAELVGGMLTGMTEAVAVERLFVLRVEPVTGRIVCQAHRGPVRPEQLSLFEAAPLDAGGILGRAVADGRIRHVADLRDREVSCGHDQKLLKGLQSDTFALMPLRFQDAVIGLLWLDNPVSGRRLTPAMLEALAPAVNLLGFILGGAGRPLAAV